MITLFPHLPYDTQETVLSYAGRLAALHAGQGVSRFLQDLGIPFARFISGEKTAVMTLATIAETPVGSALANSAIIRKTHVEFRGERMGTGFLTNMAEKFCAMCLAEDGGRQNWRHRLMWCFEPVQRCIKHNVSLDHLDQRVPDIREGLEQLDLSPTRPALTEIPSHLAWLDRRLHGDEPESSDWLSGQGLQQVLDASLMIGALLENGPKIRTQKLEGRARETAIETGFVIYQQGPASVMAALDEIRKAAPARAVQAGPLSRYGAMYDWLDRRCNARDPGPIRDLLRDHIVQHDAIAAGEVVLGVKIAQRKFHSLQSLSDASGIERRRLSRLLQKLGMVPKGASDAESGMLRFEVAAVSELLKDVETTIAFNDIPAYLGASLRQSQALYAAGIISPLFPAETPGAVRNVIFARRTLDAFLAHIEALPELETKAKLDFQTISYACQRGAGTTVDLLERIMQGHIQAVRLPGPPGIGKILIPSDQTLALATA